MVDSQTADSGDRRASIESRMRRSDERWTIRRLDTHGGSSYVPGALRADMKLIDFLTRSVTWWNGQTWGTYWFTRRHGERVGSDEFGNVYYRARTGHTIDPSMGPERRWVIYNGLAELSTVPPSWRGWLSYTFDTPPSEQPYEPREWEKPHLPNMTGTAMAYRPPGATLSGGHRPPAVGDYVAWSPEGPAERDVPNPTAHPGTHGRRSDFQPIG